MFILAGSFLLVALTPLGTLWFTHVAGLSGELLDLLKIPFLLCFGIPVIYALLSWYRGRNVALKNTAVVAWATVVNIVALGVSMFLLVLYLPLPGIYLAPIGYTLSIAAESFIMFRWGIRGTMKEVLP